MKPWIWATIASALCCWASPARAESRSVLLLIEHNKDAQPSVTIRSDFKEDRRQSVSVDEACKATKAMKGYRSTVHVLIVSDRPLADADSQELRKAVEDTRGLDLAYLREGSKVTHRGRLPKDIADRYLKSEKVELLPDER